MIGMGTNALASSIVLAVSAPDLPMRPSPPAANSSTPSRLNFLLALVQMQSGQYRTRWT